MAMFDAVKNKHRLSLEPKLKFYTLLNGSTWLVESQAALARLAGGALIISIK